MVKVSPGVLLAFAVSHTMSRFLTVILRLLNSAGLSHPVTLPNPSSVMWTVTLAAAGALTEMGTGTLLPVTSAVTKNPPPGGVLYSSGLGKKRKGSGSSSEASTVTVTVSESDWPS